MVRENSLEERSSDEGFGRGLELDDEGEKVRGGGTVEGQENILGLPERGELHGQIAMVVGGGEERERLLSGSRSSGHVRARNRDCELEGDSVAVAKLGIR